MQSPYVLEISILCTHHAEQPHKNAPSTCSPNTPWWLQDCGVEQRYSVVLMVEGAWSRKHFTPTKTDMEGRGGSKGSLTCPCRSTIHQRSCSTHCERRATART